MATNPYFNNTNSFPEQNLIEDLTIESIKIHGVDVLYLPRNLVSVDKLFGEVPLSQFDRAYLIEAHLQSVDGWEGEKELVSKFGLEIRDAATFVIARKRFKEETGLDHPAEGDLLYFPLTNSVLTIKYVNYENPFYQLGKLHVFSLKCEMFEYNHEKMQTGIEDVDNVERESSYAISVKIDTGTGSGLEDRVDGNQFLIDDSVYQGTNSSTATASGVVSSYNPSTTTLTIRSLKGTWLPNVNIKSDRPGFGPIYYNVLTVAEDFPHEPFASNPTIQSESDDTGNFSESSPFGEP